MPAHRAVLAVTSTFFRRLFVDVPKPLADGHTLVASHVRVRLPAISGATLRTIVEHLYTGRAIRATGATVNALLEAAALLQLPALRDSCLQQLRTQLLRPDTCAAIRLLAVRHGADELCAHVDAYVIQRLSADDLSVAEAVRTLTMADRDASAPSAQPIVSRPDESVVCSPTDTVLLESMAATKAKKTESAKAPATAKVAPIAHVVATPTTTTSTDVAASSSGGDRWPKSMQMLVVDAMRTQCYDFDTQRWIKFAARPPTDYVEYVHIITWLKPKGIS